MRKKLIVAILALPASLMCVCGLGGCIGGDRYERDEQGVGYAEYDGKYYVGDYDGFMPCEVIIPSTFNDKPVVEIRDNAFTDSDITAVTIPASIISIGYNVFGGCNYLEKITVSENNRNYHSDGNCLIKTDDKVLVAGCKDSEIPDDGSVTSIGDCAFYRITSLKSIEIPDSVLQIGYMAFSNCRRLENITIGCGVTKIDSYAFKDCDSLTGMTLPEGLSEFGERVFEGCTALVIYCEIPAKPTEWDYEWNHVLFTHFVSHMKAPVVWDCENNDVADDGYIYGFFGGVRYRLKDGVAAVFRQPSNIEKAVISPALSYKGGDYTVTYVCDKAMNYCHALTQLEIPDGVKTIGEEAFYGCGQLTNIVLPDSVTTIGDSAFASCSGLESITLPDGLSIIGESTFSNCRKLMNIAFPESLTSIGKSAFYSCGKLADIVIPQGVTSIGELAFYSCGNLKKVTLPDGLTSIGREAFNDCASLESINIPDSVTAIEAYTFYLCRSLKEINIPDSVTYIGSGAFYACTDLRRIVIPQSVTTVRKRVFERCSNLYIYCEAESKPDGWDDEWDIFDRYSDPVEKCIVIWDYKGDN